MIVISSCNRGTRTKQEAKGQANDENNGVVSFDRRGSIAYIDLTWEHLRATTQHFDVQPKQWAMLRKQLNEHLLLRIPRNDQVGMV